MSTTKVVSGVGVGGGIGSLGIYGILEGSGALARDIKLLYQGNEYINKADNVGYYYRRFLLDPDANDSWWREAEERIKEHDGSVDPALSDEFLKYQETGENHLTVREICRERYKKKGSDFWDQSETYKNMFRYCSIFKTKIEILEKEFSKNYEESSWGKLNKANLLSDKWDDDYPESKFIWEQFYKFVLKRDKLSNPENIDERFMKIESGEDLVEECRLAYESTPSSDTGEDKYFNNVKDYCSVNSNNEKKDFKQRPTKPSN